MDVNDAGFKMLKNSALQMFNERERFVSTQRQRLWLRLKFHTDILFRGLKQYVRFFNMYENSSIFGEILKKANTGHYTLHRH